MRKTRGPVGSNQEWHVCVLAKRYNKARDIKNMNGKPETINTRSDEDFQYVFSNISQWSPNGENKGVWADRGELISTASTIACFSRLMAIRGRCPLHGLGLIEQDKGWFPPHFQQGPLYKEHIFQCCLQNTWHCSKLKIHMNFVTFLIIQWCLIYSSSCTRTRVVIIIPILQIRKLRWEAGKRLIQAGNTASRL